MFEKPYRRRPAYRGQQMHIVPLMDGDWISAVSFIYLAAIDNSRPRISRRGRQVEST